MTFGHKGGSVGGVGPPSQPARVLGWGLRFFWWVPTFCSLYDHLSSLTMSEKGGIYVSTGSCEGIFYVP